MSETLTNPIKHLTANLVYDKIIKPLIGGILSELAPPHDSEIINRQVPKNVCSNRNRRKAV